MEERGRGEGKRGGGKGGGGGGGTRPQPVDCADLVSSHLLLNPTH